MPSPAGKGDRLKTVDEEKVGGKLTIIKIRNDHNTSSVRRDIIDPTPKPSSHVCHLLQGEGFCFCALIIASLVQREVSRLDVTEGL